MSLSRDQLQKHWEVIEAFKDGAEIQWLATTGEWFDQATPAFSDRCEYRVSPKGAHGMSESPTLKDQGVLAEAADSQPSFIETIKIDREKFDAGDTAPARAGKLIFHCGPVSEHPGIFIHDEDSAEEFAITFEGDPREVVARILNAVGPHIWKEARQDLLNTLEKHL